jgi:hypothetical protein
MDRIGDPSDYWNAIERLKRFNGALQIVRRLFALAIEEGYRNDNPVLAINVSP